MANKPLKSLNFGGADTYYPAPSMLKGVMTAGNGAAYTVTIPGLDAIAAGTSIVIIPHVTSTTKTPALNVNGLGANPIRRRLSSGTDSVKEGSKTTMFYANRAIKLTFSSVAGSTGYWLADEYPKPDATDLDGAVPIANGGTGATTAVQALQNLGITYGTDDLTAGSSPLETGKLYFRYE